MARASGWSAHATLLTLSPRPAPTLPGAALLARYPPAGPVRTPVRSDQDRPCPARETRVTPNAGQSVDERGYRGLPTPSLETR